MSSAPIPAPVGGWNARDSLDAMAPSDAVSLVNFFPGQASIETRAGCEELATGLGGEVESLMAWRGSTEKLVVAADSKLQLINLTTGGKTELANSLTNDRWQSINFNGRLIMVNGADTPAEYDGSSYATISITGATSTDLVGVTSFKGRAIYWENSSASFWYAAAGSYAGALTEFPLGIVAQSGGVVMECCTWTRDGGEGIDDMFIIVMTTGEVLVYQGDDPGSSTDWSLVGRFQIGAPLTPRGSVNIGSERVIVTKDGYLNLSAAMSSGRVTDSGNISAKIIKAVKDVTSAYASNFGWGITLYPKESMLIINVPVDPDTTSAESTYEQHVLNTSTGAWCKFTGWPAIQFVTVNDQLYFGTPDGKVFKGYVGTEDDGAFIEAQVVPAFNPLSGAGIQKHMTLCTITSDHYLPNYFEVTALADFNIPRAGTLRTPPDGSVAAWNTSDWDVDFWASSGGNEPIRNETISVAAFGFMLSVRVRVQSKIQRIRVYSLKYQFNNGRSV